MDRIKELRNITNNYNALSRVLEEKVDFPIFLIR